MGFWILMLICDLLCPVIMLIGGAFMKRGGAKKINGFCGYRTEMSMKNEDTWAFAHKHCGALWLKWGAVMLPLSVIPLLFIVGKRDGLIAAVGLAICFLQMIVLIASIIPTEKALKRAFDEDGNPREK